MKVFFISNGIWEFDGRLRELIKVASGLGDVKYITRVKSSNLQTNKNHIKIKGNNYFKFILKTLSSVRLYEDIDIIFVDNRKAIIPALLIQLYYKHRKIILDVRELYLSNEVKHITGKIGCFFEKIMIKKADIVICANKYRANVMKEYYKLNDIPLVYENIRQINYNENTDLEKLRLKYEHIFSNKTTRIISTSGYSVSRTNDKLVEAMIELGSDFELLLVGSGTKDDKIIIENIIHKNNLNNIHLIEMVNEDELKYLISHSHIGIVNYHQKDLNNKFCASGKIYEFIFEGLPVVTTENKPLVDFCADFGVGCTDNSYIEGIREINSNYVYYKKQVDYIRNNFDIEKNNLDLKNHIMDKLSTLKREQQ
ncbi:hypothetical protein [Sedimentibacter sp.]|uniref:hypothetical protein n=1 Tax=Sedimentibacter sp. TaxID=1960295 RepID=UPI00289D4DC3|nr:hypothetical protein [Sedimentibacter sp.]